MFWFVLVFSNALIPGSEIQQQFVYVLELSEANAKDSDQLIAQVWDYSLAAMFCFFCLLCFPAGGLASGVSDEEEEGCHDVSIW